jgi:hypothetical protein
MVMAKRKKEDIHSLSYKEQLAHPLWQKKSAEVKDRAGWQCEDCGSKDKQLSAHHCYYEYGKLLWEYDLDTLLCLCWGCHKTRQKIEKEAKALFAKLLRNQTPDALQELAWSMRLCIDRRRKRCEVVSSVTRLAHLAFVDAFTKNSGKEFNALTAIIDPNTQTLEEMVALLRGAA